MSKRRLAADTTDDAYATMTTRAFGAVHTNLSLLSLRAALENRDIRLALGLNVGCDLGDLIATLLEWRYGGLPVGGVIGSTGLQSAGIATWSILIREFR